MRQAAAAMLWSALVLGAAGGPPVRVENTARRTDASRYDWTVYLVADTATLNAIQEVHYVLHPSFPNPVRVVQDRRTRFALSSNGWGEFNIGVKVVFQDKRPPLHLNHWLSLTERRPVPQATAPPPPHDHSAVSTGNDSRYVGDGRWEWTVFLLADDRTLDAIECVEYTLHPTFPDPVRKVCDRGSVRGKGFFLSANGWGVFTIGVQVMFRDGDTTSLKHQLRFSGAAAAR